MITNHQKAKKKPASIPLFPKNLAYVKLQLFWENNSFQKSENGSCTCYCVKSVLIRSFSCPYFPAFRKSRNADTFCAVCMMSLFLKK